MANDRNILVSAATQSIVIVGSLSIALVIVLALIRTAPRAQFVDAPAPTRQVQVMQAAHVPVRRQWRGFGTAEPMDAVDVPAEVSAVVAMLPAEILVGAQVQAGDIIARLEESDFVQQQQIITQRIAEIDAQVAQLEIERVSLNERVEWMADEMELSRRELARVQQAFDRDGALQREVDVVEQALRTRQRLERVAREDLGAIKPRRLRFEAQKSAQQAELAVATKNVERCAIRSPLTGVLQDVDIEQGERVAIGERIVRVVNLEHIEVELKLPASARATVRRDDDVELLSRGSLGQSWIGTITRIAPADDEQRTMGVFVEVAQDPYGPKVLAPGRFVEGFVTSRDAAPRFVVPRRAIVDGHVLLVLDGVIQRQEIRVDFYVTADFRQFGVAAEQWAVLADPLPDDALIVVNMSRSLREGVSVTPVLANELPETAALGGNSVGASP